jgi:hypothetical protein
VTLAERAAAVRTREDLVAFLAALRADHDAHPDTWTNADLGSFVAALAAWAEDMEGFYENRGEDLSRVPPWRVFADLLMAARVYE